MVITVSKTPMHWNYFLAIERDLDVVSRYVEFDRRNFECFSIEIAKILLSAAAEVDVVCQELCRANGLPVGKIEQHRTGVMNLFPSTRDFQVEIPRHGLQTKPWRDWRANEPPLWWTAYNKTKHARQSEYHRANLKNAINADRWSLHRRPLPLQRGRSVGTRAFPSVVRGRRAAQGRYSNGRRSCLPDRTLTHPLTGKVSLHTSLPQRRNT